MRRALAILAAVAMIGLALVVRSRLDTRAEVADTATTTGTVICATELKAACDELALATPGLTVRIEDAGVTRATLASAAFQPLEAGVDAWIVPRPYPGMVGVDRAQASRDPVLDDESPVLARSPLVVAIWIEKEQVLARNRCPDVSVIWKCLGDVAGDRWDTIGGASSWGQVKVGLAPAERSATGLLNLAQGSAEQIGTNAYSRAELEDPAYRAWLSKLAAGVPDYNPSTGTALGQMLFQGPSAFDAAGSIEAIAAPAIAGSARYQNDLNILYPSPDATADLVVVAVRGSAHGGRVTQQLQAGPLREILARHGWRVEGQALAPSIRDVPLPSTDGLPTDPGVFVALGEAWNEVHR